MLRLIRLCYILALNLLSCGVASAASGPWAASDQVEMRLISAIDGVGSLATIPLGVDIKLQPGWKTYWQTPGEAGVPASLDWSDSPEVASATLGWPLPQRFTLLGMETFGYENHVILPITLISKNPGSALDLKAHIDLLACEKICVPQSFDVTLALPQGEAITSAQAQEINRFTARMPSTAARAGLFIDKAQWQESEIPVLIVEARSSQPFSHADLFPQSENLSFAHPQIVIQDATHLRMMLPLRRASRGALPEQLTMTLADGDRAADITIALTLASPQTLFERLTQLAPMILTALLGGLILNLMPCVLPVLSLKLLSVAKMSGKERRHVRASFLATACGILVSFLLLATALTFLKWAGGTVGWGLQFQQPVFIALMAMLLLLFAANMFDWFEILLPWALNNRLNLNPHNSNLPGEFFSGVFATLLATPCSAPFLGTAVGYALGHGPLEIFTLFAALGLGLACPYLILAILPHWSAFLPKPGMWMVHLRRLLALALAGTAIWLLFVLSHQTGPLLACLVGLAAIIIVALVYVMHGAFKPTGALLSATIALGALTMVYFNPSTWRPAAAGGEAINWQSFNPDTIKSLISQGRVVFVDVTADWCLSCKANETFILEQPQFVAALNQPGVVSMRADWTHPNDGIAKFLAHYGRYGIPFNIVYGPKAPSGVPLPELLSDEAMQSALQEVGLEK